LKITEVRIFNYLRDYVLLSSSLVELEHQKFRTVISNSSAVRRREVYRARAFCGQVGEGSIFRNFVRTSFMVGP